MKPEWKHIDLGEFRWDTPDGRRYLVWQDLKRGDWYAETGHNKTWQKVDPKKLVYRTMQDAQKACKKHYLANGGKS